MILIHTINELYMFETKEQALNFLLKNIEIKNIDLNTTKIFLARELELNLTEIT